MVKQPEEYRWSSYGGYLGNVILVFVDVCKVLDIFSNTRSKAIKEYQTYVNKTGDTVEAIDIKYNYEDVEENTLYMGSIIDAKQFLVSSLGDRNLSIEECI